jgi:hypothetical protein
MTQAYFRRRPLVVARRVSQVVTALGKAALWSMSYKVPPNDEDGRERVALGGHMLFSFFCFACFFYA